ncbi:MAG: MATE family efflux transporter [Oscillospiraceae bacterium]|nr:MATE family efflux transporter [Oscillospiraceae bacterium]
MGRLFPNKGLYQTFFPLLIVISLQQLAALTVNLVDNLMLGTYTELALSGATLVNQIQFMLQSFVTGIGTGVAVLGAQYWGKGQVDPIRRITSLGLKAGLLVGLIFFIVTLLLPEQALGLLTSDRAVVAEGEKYLRLMCWTYVIYAVSNTLMYSLQSVETAFVGTIMSLSTIAINSCLNYCLIFGHFGAPELGIRGAAIATLTSRVVELGIILVYLFFVDKKLKMKPVHLLSWDMTFLRDYIHISLPVVLTGGLWGIAQAVQTSILGHISAETIAANSIATVVSQLFIVVGMSATNASSVTIGKTIGEGNMHLVRPYARSLQRIFLVNGLISGMLIFLCKDWIISLYAVSGETAALAAQFLTVLAVVTVGSCYEYPVEAGIIGGGGNTRFAAIMDNCFMWLFTIPASYLSAFVFEFPPVVTFALLKADQLIKCIPNSIYCNRFTWVRQLTRDVEKHEE